MKTRLRAFVFSSLALTTIISHAASEEELAAFRQAYGEYNSRIEQRDYTGALQSAQQALSLGKAVFGEQSKNFAALNHNYGTTLLKASHEKEAFSALRNTLPLYEAAYGKDALEFIQLYIDLAEAERASDYESDWSRWNNDALALARQHFGKDSADYANLLIELGHIEIVNQAAHGETHIRNGFETLEKLENKPRWAFANFVMGKLEMARERYTAALPYLQVCLDTINANPAAADNVMLMTALAFQSVALEETGQSDKATAALQAIGKIKEELGDASAEPVFRAKPVFPNSVNLQQTGTRLDVQKNEGSVMVLFDVDERGFTTNHRIEFSVGPQAYIDAALEALKKSRYAPRYVSGRPTVLTNLRAQYRFLISN